MFDSSRPTTQATMRITTASKSAGTFNRNWSSILLAGSVRLFNWSASSVATATGIRMSTYTTRPIRSEILCSPMTLPRPTRSPSWLTPTDVRKLTAICCSSRAMSQPTTRITAAMNRLGRKSITLVII